MVNIKTIPDEELKKDLNDSYKDAQNCKTALLCGIVEYCGSDIKTRLKNNQYFIKVIQEELNRRDYERRKKCH